MGKGKGDRNLGRGRMWESRGLWEVRVGSTGKGVNREDTAGEKKRGEEGKEGTGCGERMRVRGCEERARGEVIREDTGRKRKEKDRERGVRMWGEDESTG